MQKLSDLPMPEEVSYFWQEETLDTEDAMYIVQLQRLKGVTND